LAIWWRDVVSFGFGSLLGFSSGLDECLLGFCLLTFTFLSLLNSGAGLDVFQIPPHRQAADRCLQFFDTINFKHKL